MLTAFVITVIDSSFHSELRFRAFSCQLPVVGFNLVANSQQDRIIAGTLTDV